jgi:hypothetical protein
MKKHFNSCVKIALFGMAIVLSTSLVKCKKDGLKDSDGKLAISEKLGIAMLPGAAPVTLTVDPNNDRFKNSKKIDSLLKLASVSKVILAYTPSGWNINPLTMQVEGQELYIQGSGSSPGRLIASLAGAGEAEATALGRVITIRANGVTINGYSNQVDTLNGRAIIEIDKSRYTTFAESRQIIDTKGHSNLIFKGLVLKNSASDGIYVASGGKFITIKDLIIDGATRNGLSIIGGDSITVVSSKFINTTGLQPAGPFAGIDIEPNGPEDTIGRISINRCTFYGNKGAQLVIGLGKYYGAVPLTNPIDIKVTYTTVTGGLENGVTLAGINKNGPPGNVYFQQVVIKNTPKQGIYMGSWAVGRARLTLNSTKLYNTGINSTSAMRFEPNFVDSKGGNIVFRGCYVDDSNIATHEAVLLGDGEGRLGFQDITGSTTNTTMPALAIKLNSAKASDPAYTGVKFKSPTPVTGDNVTITATKVTY